MVVSLPLASLVMAGYWDTAHAATLPKAHSYGRGTGDSDGVGGSSTRATLPVDLTSYVLTNTGATNGGNTFPGVSYPFGMVKLGPDLYTGSDSYSGYQPSGNLTGFSMLHESGTGGAPKYGVVSQYPVPGDVVNPLDTPGHPRAAGDVGSVGYYKSSISTGITVELAATERAGMYRYDFSGAAGSPNVVVDVSHVLPSFRGMGLGQNYRGGSIFVSQEKGRLVYQGSGSYDNGWNRSPKWTVYFCGYFDDAPGTYRTFLGQDSTGSALAQYTSASNVTSQARLGAVFSFNQTSITSRVGVSFISPEQACGNVNSQIPRGAGLEALVARAKTAWNEDVLSKVSTTDTDETKLQLLYSSMYHMLLLPTNKTGENPKWQSTEPYYDDTFTLWDLFRCTTSLFHILQPAHYEAYIRSLVDIWRHEGFMPDARSSFQNGATQGGSNADNVLADAYVKGVRGQIDWEDAYAAMVTDAEVQPPNNNDPRDPSSSTAQGRGALPDWIKYGFITPAYGRSVSRAVEYACNDFGLYQVARGLGKADDAAKYARRSRNWRNHWNPNMTSLGFSGFVGPRNAAGFIDQDPLSCGGCYWGDYYYEALPWEYSFNAHHDVGELIALSGGADRFADRLEAVFTPGNHPSGAFDRMIFNPGNEPSFTTPFLFNFVGRQDRAVHHARAVARAYYRPAPDGLPGNSDAGAMESWVLWVMLGLYPVTGQTTFLVGSPWFSDLAVDLGGGRRLRVTAAAAGGGGGGDDAYYVQSLRVNGERWTRSWVTWDDVFARGGTLDFVLGPDPANWATGPPPPSPATEEAEAEAEASRARRPPGGDAETPLY